MEDRRRGKKYLPARGRAELNKRRWEREKRGEKIDGGGDYFSLALKKEGKICYTKTGIGVPTLRGGLYKPVRKEGGGGH